MGTLIGLFGLVVALSPDYHANDLA